MSGRSKRAARWAALALVGIVAVGAAVAVQAPIAAQDHGASGPSIAPSGSVTLIPQIRTAADMQAADAALAPAARRDAQVPFMPTVSPAEYAAQKAAAAGSSSSAFGVEANAPTPNAPPTLKFINFEGVSGAETGLTPSDSHGAAGHAQYVEAVNERIRVFTKGTSSAQPTVVTTRTLKTLFGVTEKLFDPRVIYDDRWQRWIVVATRRNANATDPVRRFYVGVSRTNNAAGTWCTYTLNFSGKNGDFFDFPQLGMDLDGLIITGNIFTNTTFRTAALIPLPKAQLYNCLGFSFPKFEAGLVPTLAPPIVRDQNSAAYIISANAGGGGIVRKWTLTNSSRSPGVALAGPVVISGIAGFSIPPDAPQPGTTVRLDTLDARFVNASTQVGTNLWNIHTITVGAVSRVRWYRINTATNGILQQGTIPAATTGTHDFNASIAANNLNTAVITYSSSSTTVRAQMRFTGKQTADVSMPTGSLVTVTSAFSFTSPTPPSTTTARWGDYSAVSVDPTNPNHFWIVNQLAGGTSSFSWRTRIARVGY